jgi:hypothetical protein
MTYDLRPSAKSSGIGAALLIVALILVPTFSLADVLKCKIEGYNEDIFITTSPDTNQDDGQYARIGMGAVAFVELNTDGTPIGLLTVQKDMRVIKSRQSIDPFGLVFAPSQSAGVCTRLR